MNRIALIFLLSAIAAVMSACAAHHDTLITHAAAPTPLPASNANSWDHLSTPPAVKGPVAAIGDVLEVSVAEDNSFNGNYEVRRGGYFILPAVGRIDAAGLSMEQIEANLSRVMETTLLSHATVKVEKLGGSLTDGER